jgi:hypothetical protein
MAVATPHSRILNRVARETLRPLGAIQKGTSRTWLDDHGWWLGVVEFQASSRGRGSFLNVGVMWLWQPGDQHHVYFDLGDRVESFVAYESDEQFEREAQRLAARAAQELGRYRALIPDVAAAARILRDEAARRPGWPAWYAAVASTLAGDTEQGARLFQAVADSADDREWWRPIKAVARRLARADPEAVAREVDGWVEAYRRSLGLP